MRTSHENKEDVLQDIIFGSILTKSGHIKEWIFLPELVFMFPYELRTSPGISTGPRQNEACHQSEVHPTEQLMVRQHSTSLGWIRETYNELCSALEAAQADNSFPKVDIFNMTTVSNIEMLKAYTSHWRNSFAAVLLQIPR
ncbi:hypothetical protein Tco_1219686 [Tanacetum coccineum]